jgi:hypothetical protein
MPKAAWPETEQISADKKVERALRVQSQKKLTEGKNLSQTRQ